MKEKQIEALVQEVLNGNQSAFENLYEETKKTVYFICINFLNNEEDAKDIMQEVYLVAYNKLYQLTDKCKFSAWINQIAVNKCKKFLMKNSVSFLESEDLENLNIEEDENFLPEDYITKKEKRKIVMDIMRENLSDIQYQTVILYYFNGLTIEEIADIMECPPGTVKYRLSIARGKIKEGVLEYENINNDKLYSVAGIPLLAGLLTAEATGLTVPDLYPEIFNSLTASVVTGATVMTQAGVTESVGLTSVSETTGVTSSAGVINTGATVGAIAKTGLATLKVKIAVGVAAVALVGGGISALVIHNNNKDEEKDNKDTVESQIDESEDGQNNIASGTQPEQIEELQTYNNTENGESQSNSGEFMEYPTASELRDLLVSELGYTYCPDEDIVDNSEGGQNEYWLRYETDSVKVCARLLYAPLGERPLLLTVSTELAVSGDNEKMLETLCFVCTTEEAKATVRQYSAGTPIDDNGFGSLIEVGYESIRINVEEKWEEDIFFPYKQNGQIYINWIWPTIQD